MSEKNAPKPTSGEKVNPKGTASKKKVSRKKLTNTKSKTKKIASKKTTTKAAAEKAAAEKAAAEKAAAEKAAAEKAVTISYDNTIATGHAGKYSKKGSGEKKKNPISNTMKAIIGGLAVLITIILLASTSNSSKYRLRSNASNLELWQGNFAPLGQKCLEILPNTKMPGEVKKTYSKNEVYPIVFEYYLSRADSMFGENIKLPDFETVKLMLLKALEYSLFETNNTLPIYKRLNTIDRIISLCKADILASTGSPTSLERALVFLNKAKELTEDAALKEIITQKIAIYEAMLESTNDCL